ncbi:MAG TPA: L,D-transpeptidase family protein, partial [Candidatus Nitrosotenuis sp.]|nr:L,D-transpeptidase family protein [Candidatus Nitrosotenuis sp.]
VPNKVEGDGATPQGQFPLREVYFRADHLTKPETLLPTTPLSPDMGWCDDPDHPLYNQRITRPFSARHEELWRQDHIYDVIVVIGYNDRPAIPYKGSAIFLHLARFNYEPTAGCVAVSLPDMLEILKTVTLETQITIL